jgi:type III pantothenate kinase
VSGATLVSIGNSRIACARLDPDGRLAGVARFPIAIGDPLSRFPGDPVHLISVVLDRARHLVGAARAAGRQVTWWGAEREIPVRHPYTPPAYPGADRLVAALAAHRRAHGSCIVVDAGTAVTVDIVGPDGAFLGGAIGPGFMTLAEGLAAKAPALPLAAAGPVPRYPARSTEAAVTLGVHAAFSGLLVALVGEAAILSEKVLVTGGDAALAAGALARFHPVVVPELVLEGLAALASKTS